MVDNYPYLNGISDFFNGYRNVVEDCCEIYISYVEMILGFWGKGRAIFDKNKNNQVDLFNSYMSGYEKAKIDFGLAPKEINSDMYN